MDLLMMSMDFSDIAISNIKDVYYCCIINGISKTFNKVSIWLKKWNITKNENLLSHIKMSKEILTIGDIEIEKNKFYRHKSPIF